MLPWFEKKLLIKIASTLTTHIYMYYSGGPEDNYMHK